MKNTLLTKDNYISTGIYELDRKLNNGFCKGNLVVLAGRPSMAKTSFALNLAFNTCKAFQEEGNENKKPRSTGFISFESLPDQLTIRLLSMMTKINSYDLRRASIQGEEEEMAITKAISALEAMPLKITYLNPTIENICINAKTLKEDNNLGVLFIDYLQLITLEEGTKLSREKISYITARLKRLAIELEIPIILLSQVASSVESRQNKKPTLVDLPDSSSIAQDADIVMFVHREEIYLRRQEPSHDSPQYKEWADKLSAIYNLLEVSIAKHRNGITGSISLNFEDRYCLVSPLDRGK